MSRVCDELMDRRGSICGHSKDDKNSTPAMQVICTKATRGARVRRTSPSTPRGKSAFEVQREPKNCCGSSVSQSLAALFGCGSFVAGYVDRYCAVLCAGCGHDSDGGAKDLEAEAWEIGRCGDEMGNRLGLRGWRGTLDKPYSATNRAIWSM